MAEGKDNFNRNAWIVGSSLVALFGFGYYWYNRGQKDVEGPQVQYPPGDGTFPSGWSPVPLVDELHDAMSGLFDTPVSKDNAYGKILSLANSNMVRAVYNVFNQKYFSEKSGTLTKWIRDEIGWFQPNRQKVLALFSTLNLE